MAQQRAAYRYAKAALSLATEKGTAEAVNNDMSVISETINSHADLKNMLFSPVIRTLDKKAVLFKVFTSMDEVTVNTIDTLFVNNRIYLLKDGASRYTSLYEESIGMQTAKVTTAVPLTPELEAQVLSKVRELTGKEVEVKNIVDPSILGGFILRVGDIQYNASIANKLNKLKREFSLN
ncbi:MAG: ATP synthase F1 subunit delta [Flavobacteriaceae bacterium]|nr:ATP synthase F1 subunit delta [Flavobacteriaceae bacterium]